MCSSWQLFECGYLSKLLELVISRCGGWGRTRGGRCEKNINACAERGTSPTTQGELCIRPGSHSSPCFPTHIMIMSTPCPPRSHALQLSACSDNQSLNHVGSICPSTSHAFIVKAAAPSN